MPEWIAIVNFDQGAGSRAIVIMNEELEDVAMFKTSDEIATLQKTHFMRQFNWWAFNVATGETEEL